MTRSGFLGLATSVVIALTAGPTFANDYNATRGALDGSKHAARLAIDAKGRDCGLNRKQLAAMMLAVSFFEVAGDPRTQSASPMALSRGDNAAARSDNIYLNSFNTINNRKRAFWAPGVGLFQIDTASTRLNHWQRTQPKFGGKLIARLFLDAYCAAGAQGVRDKMYGTWFACRSSARCWNAYNEVYVNGSSGLKLDIVQGATSWTGGVSTKTCKLGISGASFTCGYIDPGRAEGWFFTDHPQGTESASNPNGYTPLPAPFFSYSKGVKRWAAWLEAGSGFARPVTRWARLTADARAARIAWADSSNLYVKYCVDEPGGPPPECGWSSTGYVP